MCSFLHLCPENAESGFLKMLVTMYETIWYHNPGIHGLNFYHHGITNLSSLRVRYHISHAQKQFFFLCILSFSVLESNCISNRFLIE